MDQDKSLRRRERLEVRLAFLRERKSGEGKKMGERTNDKRTASLSRRGAELVHPGGYFIGLCELAVFLKEGLEFRLDMCHACDFVRMGIVKIKGKDLGNGRKFERRDLGE